MMSTLALKTAFWVSQVLNSERSSVIMCLGESTRPSSSYCSMLMMLVLNIKSDVVGRTVARVEGCLSADEACLDERHQPGCSHE